MDFYESDLEDIIWECLQRDQGIERLHEKGLFIPPPTKSFRQLRIGNYGTSDIVTVQREAIPFKDGMYSCIRITEIELKKGEIKLDALVQLFRYIKGIKHYFKHRGYKIDDINLTGMLVGSDLNSGDWIYLADEFNERVDFYTYNYSIDGINFTRDDMGYFLTNGGFK